jgi:PAS domain S-box-containing protein
LDTTAIVIADATGTIRFWSKGAETAFGYSEADAMGRTLDLIVPEEFREAHWTGFRREMASGSAAIEGQPVTLPVRASGGQIQMSPGKLSLLRRGDGNIIGAMVIFG